jgi:hypothetical protein
MSDVMKYTSEGVLEWIWQFHRAIEGAVRLPDGSTLIASDPLLHITVTPVEIVRKTMT